MKLRPGSALWLLRHELRMFYFRLGSSKAKGAARRGPGLRLGLIMAGAAIAIHLLAWKLLSFSSGDGGATPAPMLIAITATIILVFSLMLSQAFKASIEVLFERGDLDLLLSSPLSSRSIFVVRLGAVVVGTATLYLFLLAPVRPCGAGAGAAPLAGHLSRRAGRRRGGGLGCNADDPGAGAPAGRAPHPRGGPGAGRGDRRLLFPAVPVLRQRRRPAAPRSTAGWTAACSTMAGSIKPACCGCPPAPCWAPRCRCWRWPRWAWAPFCSRCTAPTAFLCGARNWPSARPTAPCASRRGRRSVSA